MYGGEEKYGVFVGSGERKRPFERRMLRWEGNIEMDVTETGRGVDWIGLAYPRPNWRDVLKTERIFLIS
jgi:hypothetical protein